LNQFLQAQGYVLLGEEDIEDDTGRKVYRVSNNGVTEYLHLFTTDSGRPVLLLGQKDMTLEQLKVLAEP
jgi:hypothetical protein